MTPAEIKKLMDELGIPMLPPDHPEYTMGPQIYFVSRAAAPKRKRKKSASAVAPDGAVAPKEA